MYTVYYYKDNASFGFDLPEMAFGFAERMEEINGTEYVVQDSNGYMMQKKYFVHNRDYIFSTHKEYVHNKDTDKALVRSLSI